MYAVLVTLMKLLEEHSTLYSVLTEWMVNNNFL